MTISRSEGLVAYVYRHISEDVLSAADGYRSASKGSYKEMNTDYDSDYCFFVCWTTSSGEILFKDMSEEEEKEFRNTLVEIIREYNV